MGFMETSLMRQLGKLVEVVRHANEVLGDGYRLCVVSADHLAVQGGLTDVLRQLAVGFSRPQSQCLVSGFENFTVTDFDSLQTLPVGGLPPFSCLVPVCLSFDILFTVGTLTFCDRRGKIPPPSWWSEGVWGSQNITSLPLRTR